MTVARSILAPAVALLVACAGVARAQQPAPPGPRATEDALGRLLFPPELVMQHQQDIGLRPEQRTAITKAIQELQTKVIDLQWKMQEQSQRLATLLQKPVVDQPAALTQLDEMLGIERDVKRAHITLLIQIKNTLTADQQAKLAAARGAAPPS
jgi:Spy/CpxP family protein refolding chaperone